MPRIQITFTNEQVEVIQREADRRGAPFAAIVREAVEEWAERRGITFTDDVTWGGPRSAGDNDKGDESEGQEVAVAAR